MSCWLSICCFLISWKVRQLNLQSIRSNRLVPMSLFTSSNSIFMTSCPMIWKCLELLRRIFTKTRTVCSSEGGQKTVEIDNWWLQMLLQSWHCGWYCCQVSWIWLLALVITVCIILIAGNLYLPMLNRQTALWVTWAMMCRWEKWKEIIALMLHVSILWIRYWWCYVGPSKCSWYHPIIWKVKIPAVLSVQWMTLWVFT